MEWTHLTGYMTPLSEGKRLSALDKQEIGAGLPALIRQVEAGKVPEKIVTPTGETLRSATRITALKSYSILLARKAFGQGYIRKDPVYEEAAKDLLFFIMRDYFRSGGVKGEFCCPACTLSLLPLYATNCFKWVDCRELETNVKISLEEKRSVFAGTFSQKYADWALRFG